MPPGKVDPRAENAVLQRRERAWAQALERANRELEIANSELEAFSISASHELRTPLLDIIWCLDKCATDHAGTPAGDDRRLLHLIRQGAGRMHQLIDDLLRLSTLSRQPLATATASMESIARKIAAIGRFAGGQRNAWEMISAQSEHPPPFQLKRQIALKWLREALVGISV